MAKAEIAAVLYVVAIRAGSYDGEGAATPIRIKVASLRLAGAYDERGKA
jgi:hypothetical protein